jgi:hypothetical protein
MPGSPTAVANVETRIADVPVNDVVVDVVDKPVGIMFANLYPLMSEFVA